MFYQNLKFPEITGRPFFYTNFVQTVDGKTQVKSPGYWPIGSKNDYQVLLELRANADCLIHGSNLASEFGEITLNSLAKEEFKALRKELGKNPDLEYLVVTNHPEKFKKLNATIVSSDLNTLVKTLQEKGYRHILVEGGPTLLGSFINRGLIDEVFLTIAPKIYGSKNNTALTLVEGVLFPPSQIKKLKLVSSKAVENELFLRYQVSH